MPTRLFPTFGSERLFVPLRAASSADAMWKTRRMDSRCARSGWPFFKAISEGERGFTAIAVVTDTDSLTPPCGACRQLIWEFCGDVPVILANLHGKTEIAGMRELFPKPFDASNL